tara:strand:+ start:1288 stop:1428 length:141 start_codon:yes stop_codon:yes gene_type:complete
MKTVKINPKVDIKVKIKSDGQGEGGQRAAKPSPRPLSGYNLPAGKK